MKNLYMTDGTGLGNNAVNERQMIEKRVETCIKDILLILESDIPSAEIEMYIIEEVMDKFLQAHIDKRTKLLRKEKSNE